MTPEDQAARERIEQKWAEVEELDYWGILEVRPGSGDAELKQAYFALARQWHVDAFSGRQLGPSSATLDKLFSRIAEAYEVLTDPKKRAEWEAQLAIQAAGTSTDVGALLEAESEFDKGRVLLERGEVKAAARLFAHVYEVNPANLEWRAHHMYASWWLKRDQGEARDAALALEKMQKEHPQLVDAAYFAGRLYLEVGDLEKAGRQLKRAIGADKNHKMANRDLRLLARKKEEAEKKKGFFARFLKKK